MTQYIEYSAGTNYAREPLFDPDDTTLDDTARTAWTLADAPDLYDYLNIEYGPGE